MAKSARSASIYRWWIVGASFIGLSVCQSPVVFLSFGVFMKPLAATFGWGRGPMSLALSLAALSLAAVSPIIGAVIDRFGARRVMLPSMIGFGLLFASLYFLSGSLLHLYAVYLLLGVVGAGANNVAYVRVITAWFGRLRGRALGIASSGVAMGAAALSFLSQQLIDRFGWRVAYLGIGCVILFVAMPIVAAIIRDRPADLGFEPEPGIKDAPASTPVGVGEILQQPLAWTMIAIGFLVAVSLHGAQIHMVPLLTDRGMSPDVAAGTMAFIMATCTVISRMVVGSLFDYFFAPRVSIIAFLLSALGLILVMSSDAIWPCYALAVLMGIGQGAESDVLGYLTSRYFGLRAFGRVYGMVFAGFMVGTAVAPYLFGVVFDWTHTYQAALGASVALIVVMCVVLATLPRFPRLDEDVLSQSSDASLTASAQS